MIRLAQNKTLETLTFQVNNILHDIIPEDIPTLELNNTIFGAALYIQRKTAPWYDEKRQKPKRGKKHQMPWKYKMQKKIYTLRKELSLLAIKDPPTKHTAKKIKRIHRKYKLKESQVKDRVAEHQAEIKGLAETIRNRENKEKPRIINSQFSTKLKKRLQ